MIGRLKGKVISIDGNQIILDVADVGYIVHCHPRLVIDLSIGMEIVLFIEHIVKEFENKLFGFIDLKEKEIFTILRGVQGVAGKTAMTIIGLLSIDELFHSVEKENSLILTTVPGVGDKLATRIINELRRNKDWKKLAASVKVSPSDLGNKVSIDRHNLSNDKFQDAVSILTNLGFSKANAEKAIHEVSTSVDIEQTDLQQIVRLCLARCN